MERRVIGAIKVLEKETTENTIEIVVFSGGHNESVFARAVFLRECKGGKEKRLLTENESATTFENAVFTKKLLEEKKIAFDELVIVTDAWHSFRAMALFRRVFQGRAIRFEASEMWWESPIPLTHLIWCGRELVAIVKSIYLGHISWSDLFFK